MIHESPGTGATIVVDHDHEGDGDASDYVEGEEALDGILREGRIARYGGIGDCGLLFSETWLHCYPVRIACTLRYALGAGCAKGEDARTESESMQSRNCNEHG